MSRFGAELTRRAVEERYRAALVEARQLAARALAGEGVAAQPRSPPNTVQLDATRFHVERWVQMTQQAANGSPEDDDEGRVVSGATTPSDPRYGSSRR